MEKRLFLLDAYALIYRAYYALIHTPRFATTAGFNTSAIFGFCNTLDDLLRKENPTHVAVCFDPPHGRTFRHEKFEAYKAQRDKQPEDITLAIPYIKLILEGYRIPSIEIPGYEADDVIGTLATRAAGKGYDTYMMTPDKDYGQLVAPHIYMYRPALKGEGFEVRDVAKVCERYGISSPRQVIDLLALEGDASDNIPGCPGVGEKTARKLIDEWGSVENLLENTDKLTGALQRRIKENVEQIRMSKWLATICTDAPIDINVDDLIRRPIDADRLMEVFRELDFKSLMVRLKAQIASDEAVRKVVAEPAATPVADDGSGMGSLFDSPALETEEVKRVLEERYYEIVESPERIAEIVKLATAQPAVGMAAYAPGEESMTARLEGLALSWEPCRGYFIPFPKDDVAARAMVRDIVAPLFDKCAPLMVNFDVKRTLLLLRHEGISLDVPYFDVSVAHYVIDPEMKHDVATIALKYLDLLLQGVPADIRPGHPKSSLEPEAAMSRYCEEADLALRLRPRLEAEVAEREMAPLLEDVEFPLIRVLADMEWTGVRIDPSVLTDLSVKLKEQVSALERKAYAMAGGPFNIASPAQVGMVLFDRLAIDPKAKRTARGSYSTTEQVLEKYAHKVPLVGLILKIRRLRKLITTYLDALPALINPETGKIHTSFNQTVTATGRISSTNPNLQNIPIRTDDGREIRRAFIPEQGDLMMSADYSQIELRLIADLSGDKDMIDGFLSGDDIHRITASKVYKKPLEEVTEDERRHAKTANFGIIYGISAFGLSERLGIARPDAKKLIDGYFETYPRVREYLDNAVFEARERGYVTTRMGRRRYLPDINSRNAVVRGYAERNAVNAPIQGSAADIIKVAMVRIYAEMQRRSFRSRMIMQVHDELIFNVVPDELDELKRIVVEGMESAYAGAVPLEVAAGVASNWLEAH